MPRSCRITAALDSGIDILHLENESLRVIVLPGKGGDVYAIVYKPLDLDVLLKTAKGLRPFAGRDLRSNRMTWYSEVFVGGWMDVLPHRARYREVDVPQEKSGIAATLPWAHEVAEDSGDRCAVKLKATLPVIPLAVEKTISLTKGIPEVLVEETVRNTGDAEARFTWTQHPTFGGAFLDEDVEVILPRCTVFRPREYARERSRGLAAFEGRVDDVKLPDGRTRDLRRLAPRAAREDLFVALKDLEAHQAALLNRRRSLEVRLSWDPSAFPYLRYWFRSSEDTYTVGLEPSNDCFADMDDSIAHGTFLSLAPGAAASAWITCAVDRR